MTRGTLIELLEDSDRTRRAANASVLSAGLPHPKHEAWRSTPLRDLPKTCFEREISPLRLDGDVPPEIEVARVAPSESATLERLGTLTTDATFTALNATLFDQVVHVRVPAGVAASLPLSLTHRVGGGRASFPRLLVELEARASLTLVEHFEGDAGDAGFAGAVTEVLIGADAQLSHVRLLDAPSHHVGELDVRVARGGGYRLHLATLGGALSRIDLNVTLAEEGAECALYSATHATAEQVADVHVLLTHAAAHCSSRQRFHSVLDGKARAIVDGIVAVAHGAQKTEAHQNLATLLLSGQSRVDAKPHMEIEADDVVCSHGNTVGALDDEALFYLRSRGIDANAARTILTWAFVKSALDGMPGSARPRVERAFLERFSEGGLDGSSVDLEEL